MQQKKLTVVYQPKFKASEFVVNGIRLPEVDVVPLEHRAGQVAYALYGIFLFLHLYRIAFIFRYSSACRNRLKNAAGRILFWDSCSFEDYHVMHSVYGASREKFVFFWNPLTRWSRNTKFLMGQIRELEKCGYSFCTFDMHDSETYNIKLVRNVNRRMDDFSKAETEQDFYFVGSPKERRDFLVALEKRLREQGFSTKFMLIESKADYISNYENIELSGKSACIVDVASGNQKGLTLRPFDALFLKKKLITNCKHISQMDFYDPSNIYIVESLELEGIVDFMRKPYKEIDPAVVEKYEVNCWVRENFLSK